MIEALDAAIQAGHRAAADRDAGQMNFFESFSDTSSEPDDHTATDRGETSLDRTMAHQRTT